MRCKCSDMEVKRYGGMELWRRLEIVPKVLEGCAEGGSGVCVDYGAPEVRRRCATTRRLF